MRERTDAEKVLCDLLSNQAKKCETTRGAVLLLSMMNHIYGVRTIEGCDELWQAADVIGQWVPDKPAPIPDIS